MTIEFRSARRSERDQVLDLLAHWYNDREFFARYNQLDPTFRDELCLLALDHGRIVSTVQIFDRKINLAGQSVPLGGIGSVFTLKEYRHQRVASGLMQLSIAVMEREGFEVSMLFAERLTFYNQFGWKEVNRNFSVLPSAAALAVPAGFEIDAFEPARDLPEVTRIHRDYSSRFNVTAVRDENDWRGNLAYAGNIPADPIGGCEEYFILARHGRDIAAYARVTRFHGIVMVMEYGYVPGGVDGLLALLRHLAEMALNGSSSCPMKGDHQYARVLRPDPKHSGPAVLVTHSEHDPGLERTLAESGCPAMHHDDNNYMWRIMLPEKLGRRFGMKPEDASKHAFAMFADPRSLYWTADRF